MADYIPAKGFGFFMVVVAVSRILQGMFIAYGMKFVGMTGTFGILGIC
jgi:hypothetical protein